MNTLETKRLIEEILQDTFAPVVLDVVDESHKHAGHAGVMERGGGHFKVKIVSDIFAGMVRVRRQKMVHAALAGVFAAGKIHALSIRAKALAETEKV